MQQRTIYIIFLIFSLTTTGCYKHIDRIIPIYFDVVYTNETGHNMDIVVYTPQEEVFGIYHIDNNQSLTIPMVSIDGFDLFEFGDNNYRNSGVKAIIKYDTNVCYTYSSAIRDDVNKFFSFRRYENWSIFFDNFTGDHADLPLKLKFTIEDYNLSGVCN
jgi:hypothetical protein